MRQLRITSKRNQLQLEDFNFDVFGEDYYAKKFPHFEPEVHEILARVSQEKIIDLRKQNEFFKIQPASVNPFEEDNKISD